MVKYVHWKVKFKRSKFIKVQFYDLIRRCIIHFIRDGEVQPEQHVDSISSIDDGRVGFVSRDSRRIPWISLIRFGYRKVDFI